jgi:gliding motility-associated-like protein
VIAMPATNATYTVTGTDINNCKDTAIVTVRVNPLPTFSITPLNSADCVPICVDFAAYPADTNVVYKYKWVFGNGTVSSNKADHTCYSTAGTFTPSLTLTDSITGCKSTATATVNAFPVPTADFSYAPSSTTIFNPDIYFNDLSGGATIVSWTWFFGDGDSSQAQYPIHTYLDTGLYYPHLAVVSNKGCWNIKWDVLYIAPECLIYVPNAFTPNGDNTNDTFAPKGEGIYDFSMHIYDRWGNLMYHTTDITKGWDGTKGGTALEQDTYAWKIEIRNYKGEPKQLSGTVTLFK